ncbi:hypothetical protein TGGT1_260520 [Toxoplasma gondii GT1]|uniref:Uncharacterized protein n=4 Tax=Toxoplasma gondii TaxID=5811 RepID=S7UYP6_TOXGG|nr:hypothetical protein TGGT1_260520 [Toxoplasma gondii GT1]KAF4641172.1 hypothetical protein TGRH88_069820 [Toxoplasma gondii]KFH15261.1 hypothetical protein TGMAS_260520 [Toxoplasma gondii MAS]PIM05285.1 hypothetical protein TGCOUG_260520 [Toxoplasma gondii COUG]
MLSVLAFQPPSPQLTRENVFFLARRGISQRSRAFVCIMRFLIARGFLGCVVLFAVAASGSHSGASYDRGGHGSPSAGDPATRRWQHGWVPHPGHPSSAQRQHELYASGDQSNQRGHEAEAHGLFPRVDTGAQSPVGYHQARGGGYSASVAPTGYPHVQNAHSYGQAPGPYAGFYGRASSDLTVAGVSRGGGLSSASYAGGGERGNQWMGTAVGKAMRTVRQKLSNLSQGLSPRMTDNEDPFEVLQTEIVRLVKTINRLSTFCEAGQGSSLMQSNVFGWGIAEAIDPKESERQAVKVAAVARAVLYEAAALVDLLFVSPSEQTLKEASRVFQERLHMLRDSSNDFRGHLQALRGAMRAKLSDCAPLVEAPRRRDAVQGLWKRCTARANSVVKYVVYSLEHLVPVVFSTLSAVLQGFEPESRIDFRLTDKVLSISESIDTIQTRALSIRAYNEKLLATVNQIVSLETPSGISSPLGLTALGGTGNFGRGTGYVPGSASLGGGIVAGTMPGLLTGSLRYGLAGDMRMGTNAGGLGPGGPATLGGSAAGGLWGHGGTGALPVGGLMGSSGGGLLQGIGASTVGSIGSQGISVSSVGTHLPRQPLVATTGSLSDGGLSAVAAPRPSGPADTESVGLARPSAVPVSAMPPVFHGMRIGAAQRPDATLPDLVTARVSPSAEEAVPVTAERAVEETHSVNGRKRDNKNVSSGAVPNAASGEGHQDNVGDAETIDSIDHIGDEDDLNDDFD